MQKILVCLTLAAFATITSLQAGEQCTAAKTSSCDTAKVAATAGGCCTASKTVAASKSCCSAAKVAKKNTDVKGAVLLVQR